jgi:hypothetical protein
MAVTIRHILTGVRQDFRFLDVFRGTLDFAPATVCFAAFFTVVGFGVALLVAAFFTDLRLTGVVARVAARLSFIAARFTFAAAGLTFSRQSRLASAIASLGPVKETEAAPLFLMFTPIFNFSDPGNARWVSTMSRICCSWAPRLAFLVPLSKFKDNVIIN